MGPSNTWNSSTEIIFIHPTAKEITCPVSHSRCAQKQSLSVEAQSPNPGESRISRGPNSCPPPSPARGRLCLHPSGAGEGICALPPREGGYELYLRTGRTSTGIPVAPGVPLGLGTTFHLLGRKDVLEDTAASAIVLRCPGYCVPQVEQG